jgi:hypothetical protein
VPPAITLDTHIQDVDPMISAPADLATVLIAVAER